MGWWTGLGWATPGGGQALIRSHRPVEGAGAKRLAAVERCVAVNSLVVAIVEESGDPHNLLGLLHWARIGATRWSVMLLTGGTPTLNPHHTAPRMYRRSRPVVLSLVSSSKRKWPINGHVRSSVRERILPVMRYL